MRVVPYVNEMGEVAPRSLDETMTPRERRLAARLEGFGDIVFGFAISQCALQLPQVNRIVSSLGAFPIFMFFATFALVALLWLGFHRLLSGAFVPKGIDLFGAFMYLALVSLFPYSMYGMSHSNESDVAARTAFMQYSALYAMMMAIAGVLTFRALRRGWKYADAAERDYTWQGLLRCASMCIEMSIAFVLAVLYGPTIGGLFLFTLPILLRGSRFVFPHAPSALAPK